FQHGRGRGSCSVAVTFFGDGDVHVYTKDGEVWKSGVGKVDLKNWTPVRLEATPNTVKVYANGTLLGAADVSKAEIKPGGLMFHSRHQGSMSWLRNARVLLGGAQAAAPSSPVTQPVKTTSVSGGQAIALAQKIAETKAVTGEPMKDGFYLNGEVLANLKQYWKKENTTEKSIAILGDDLANSGFLVAPLMRTGGELEGRTLFPHVAFCGNMQTLDKLYGKLERGLKRRRPEVLIIMAGYTDLTRAMSKAEAMKPLLLNIVDKALSEGVLPVLVTLPREPLRQDPFTRAFGEWNKALIQVSKERRIPLIEAAVIVNRAEKPQKMYSAGKLKQDAYEAINELFLKVYRAIEVKVFERGGSLLAPAETPQGGEKPKPSVEQEAIEEVKLQG
ncbi:MAG: hypothetical protein AB1744_14985, partial [Candidatus Zixiibacteriota bacterium]